MFCTGEWVHNTICEWHTTGHVGLVCTEPNCGIKYSTKNIGYIGARSIFPHDIATECDHGLNKLQHTCPDQEEWEKLLKEEAA